MDRSALFTAYNQARKLAYQGHLDMERVNRALGIALRKEPRPYYTTTERCDCADSVGRSAQGVVCKHRIAEGFKEVAHST